MDTLKIIGVVSLFVVFILFVFQPFGISTIESNAFWICLGFGVTTFLATALYEFVMEFVLHLKTPPEKWTFWKWILNNLGILLVISLANFLYARLWLFGYVDWSLFPHMLYGTLMIGIIPLLMIGGWALMKAEQKYQHIAERINQQPARSQATGGGESSVFSIPLSRFRYAEALQNYVRIGYIDETGQFATKTERTTLKYILQKTKDSAIVRTHRSFLVNRNYILSAQGNAQGLLLSLADCDFAVPVSRSHVASFRPA